MRSEYIVELFHGDKEQRVEHRRFHSNQEISQMLHMDCYDVDYILYKAGITSKKRLIETGNPHVVYIGGGIRGITAPL